MRRLNPRGGLGFALATMVVAASFVGCPLLKKKPPPAEEEEEPTAAPDAATVSATGVGAKNEANVLRYANETPLPNVPAVIGDHGAKARNFPGNGPEVASLQKGTPVAKIAQYFSTAVLIMFDDPSGDGSKLIGWVTPKAFDVAAPPPTKTVVVPPPRVVDAGTPTVKDAGTTTQDAGITSKDAGTSTTDAGGGSKTVPEPPKGVPAVPLVEGKCPWSGWTVSDGMCRRKCNADADCPRNTKCKAAGATKVCTSS